MRAIRSFAPTSKRVLNGARKYLPNYILNRIMSSTYFRRTVLRASGVVFALGATGCTEYLPYETSSDETTVAYTTTRLNSTTTRPRSTSSEETTVAPSIVSDEEAKERTLTAEEEFLTEQLQNASCLTDWGVTPGSISDATVTKRTADGVYVAVTVEWYYTKGDTDDDGASNAVYVVTADSIKRVQGDKLSPC